MIVKIYTNKNFTLSLYSWHLSIFNLGNASRAVLILIDSHFCRLYGFSLLEVCSLTLNLLSAWKEFCRKGVVFFFLRNNYWMRFL